MSSNISKIRASLFEAAKTGNVQNVLETIEECKNFLHCTDLYEDGKYSSALDFVLNSPSAWGDKSLTTTPLIMAARSDQLEVVRLLLEKYHVCVEQTGMVEFAGHPIIKGATALWCAASIGNLSMVKMLIEEFDAEVDHATVTNSTPLRPACFDGFIDVVEYLVTKGASVNTPTNYYSNTCLLIASYNGHEKVVTYLLEHGARIEMQDFLGQTALHNAAERGHMNIAKELIKHGAGFVPDKKSLTPLHVACDFNHVEMVTYFLSIPDVFSTQDHIQATELLAASFANGSDNYSIEKCYIFFAKAMEMRFLDPDFIMTKEVFQPEEVFNYQRESQTCLELERLKNNEDKLNTEALLAKERILGKLNVNTLDLVYRGAVLADRKDYASCIKLWERAALIKRHNNESISQDLERYGELFSEMIEESFDIDLKEMFKILVMCVEEFRVDQGRIAMKKHDSEMARIQANIKTNMHTSLFLISAIFSLSSDEKDLYETKRIVYQLVKLNPILESRHGYSFLHIVCDMDTEMNEYFAQSYVTCPNINLVDLLLECGINPNIQDEDMNTPLHVLSKICRIDVPESDHVELRDWRTCSKYLLDHGAHIDYRNCEGKMPIDYRHITDILSTAMNKRPLKCLCACVLKSHNISYKNKLPANLESFVDKH